MNETQTEQNQTQHRAGGAPKNNRNRMRHGLTAAKLPAGCQYIEHRVGQFRRQLESEIIECHGEITILSAALVQSAVRHETRAKLLQRWLREGEDEVRTNVSKGGTNGSSTTQTTEVKRTTLSITERSGLLRDISSASDSRDRCIERLDLKQSNNAPWPGLPALPEPSTSEDASKSIATHLDVESHEDGTATGKSEASPATEEESGT